MKTTISRTQRHAPRISRKRAGVAVPHQPLTGWVARGKATQADAPCASDTTCEPSPTGDDPLELLERQAQTPVPDSELALKSCGDAHVSESGVSASPERRLAFGINDLDQERIVLGTGRGSRLHAGSSSLRSAVEISRLGS